MPLSARAHADERSARQAASTLRACLSSLMMKASRYPGCLGLLGALHSPRLLRGSFS